MDLSKIVNTLLNGCYSMFVELLESLPVNNKEKEKIKKETAEMSGRPLANSSNPSLSFFPGRYSVLFSVTEEPWIFFPQVLYFHFSP